MLTDTHCHLDFHKFDEDREAMLQRAWEAGITRLLIPGLDLESSLAVNEMAKSHPSIFAAAGFLPTEAEKWDGDSYEKLKDLVMEPGGLPLERQEQAPGLHNKLHNKIVAIGEIGLD